MKGSEDVTDGLEDDLSDLTPEQASIKQGLINLSSHPC